MSKEVAPLLYINLCAETVYVIEQRLRAQNISSDKTVSILNDMIGYLFLASRVREMFEPQGTPTLSAAKSLMQSLVNCSVMKVTGDSMSKLCDLAIMAFKFQIMCSSRVDQLLEITRQHLNTIGAILKQHGDTRLGSRVTEVLSLFDNTYSGRTPGELHRMRQCLLQVLQEQRIKVSVLLDVSSELYDCRAAVHGALVLLFVQGLYYDVPCRGQARPACSFLPRLWSPALEPPTNNQLTIN
ncbi:hypothetical protein PLESTF_000673800 [Pleodorina starrii]|nr:hypothetical protein PLESTF_000673800 [Pleodorina starrii]